MRPGGSRRLGRPLCTEAHSSPRSWLLSSPLWPTPCKTQANSLKAMDSHLPKSSSPHISRTHGEHESSHGWILQFFLLAHTSTYFSSGELQTSQLCHTITFQGFKTVFIIVLPQAKEFQLVYNLFLAISFPSPFNPPPALHIKIRIKIAV